MSKRAIRRCHLRRMKKKAEKAFDLPVNKERARKWANHMCLCSKVCCGNPRKHLKQKQTLQELKADIKYYED